MNDIRVLVVEDEPIAAAAHAAYVGRLEGFTLAGSAPDGQSALRLMTDFAAAGTPVELVLLDMNLPDLHGLDIARRMRAAGLFADIIAITAVRELTIVRSAVATGVVQYLIKPSPLPPLRTSSPATGSSGSSWPPPPPDRPVPVRRRAMWTRPSRACGPPRNCPCPRDWRCPPWNRCRTS